MARLILFCALLSTTISFAQNQPIFKNLDLPHTLQKNLHDSVIQQRMVLFDAEALRSALRQEGPVVLPLFDNFQVPVTTDSMAESGLTILWRGHIDGEPLSRVDIALTGHIVEGVVVLPGTTVHLNSRAKGIVEITERETPRFESCDANGEINHAPRHFTKSASLPFKTNSTLHQVKILYLFDGELLASMTTLTAQYTASLNEIYGNPFGANDEIFFVGEGIVLPVSDYDGPQSAETARNALAADLDDPGSQVSLLKKQYLADVVVFISHDYYAPWDGYAHRPTKSAVVEEEDALSIYLLAHEVGHLFELEHDRIQYYGGPFSNCDYGYGADILSNGNPTGDIGITVMAYASSYSDQGNVVRVPYLSQPEMISPSNGQTLLLGTICNDPTGGNNNRAEADANAHAVATENPADYRIADFPYVHSARTMDHGDHMATYSIESHDVTYVLEVEDVSSYTMLFAAFATYAVTVLNESGQVLEKFVGQSISWTLQSLPTGTYYVIVESVVPTTTAYFLHFFEN